MRSGIYRLVIGTRYYYGRSVNMRTRFTQHRNDLINGRHRNPRMQRTYDKYRQIEFQIVCYAPADTLEWLEQAFLDRYISDENCMNIATDAHCPRSGLRHTEATRQLIRERSSSPDCRKPVIVSGKWFDSLKSCAEHYGIPKQTLSRWLRGSSNQPNSSPYMKYRHLRHLTFAYAAKD